QSRTPACQGLRIQAIHHFVGGSIAADGDEVSDAALVGIMRDPGGLAGNPGVGDFDCNAAGPQALKRGAEQLAASATSGRRVYDCKVVLPQVLRPSCGD